MDKTAYLPDGNLFAFWEKEQLYDKEIHVDQKHPLADDSNNGSPESPFLTIQAAAKQAVPGTRVVIHGGVYREWVRPVRGGADAEHMISYEAFDQDEEIGRAHV